MKLPNEPYLLTEKDYARIEKHKTLRMYREISQMLDIYYPGFWDGVTDEKVKLAWMEKVHQLANKYGDTPILRGEIEQMASICSIIGLDFETNPKFNFIVNKLKTNHSPSLFRDIHDYLRFEVLQKEFSQMGTHYNTWSLRGVQDGMPPITRYIPDFYTEAKPQNPNENVYKIYKNTVLNKVRK